MMDKENNDIEDIFKNSFKDFEPEVNPSVWKNIQTGLKGAGLGVLGKTILNKIGSNAIVAVVSSAATVISTVVVMNWTGNSNKPIITSTTISPKATVESPQPVAVKDIKNFLSNTNPSVPAAKKENAEPAVAKENSNTVSIGAKDKKTLESVINKYSGEQVASISPSTIGGPVPLIVNLTNSGTGKINKWSFNDGTKSVSAANPIKVFDIPGIYTVKLTSTNTDGKTAVDSVKIEVTGNSYMATLPNEFSPNGDGNNDTFAFNPVNMVSMSAEIVDKNNHMVYKSEKLGDKWDGNDLKGNKAKDGIYFYIFKTVGADGKKYEKTGVIRLTR